MRAIYDYKNCLSGFSLTAKVFLFFTVCIGLHPLIYAQTTDNTYTWTGAVSTDWDNAQNWNPPYVPTNAIYNIVIPEVSTGYYPISYTGMGWSGEGSLLVEENASFTIQGDGTVQFGITCGTSGQVTNNGEIIIYNCINGIGVEAFGALYNQGSIEIVHASNGMSITGGEVNNFGSISISRTGSSGIFLSTGDFLFTNEEGGTISIEQSRIGISNQSSILNNGVISIQKFSDTGIVNFDGIENNNQIKVINLQGERTIYNNGTFANQEGASILSGGFIDDGSNMINRGLITIVASDNDSHIHNNLDTIIVYGPVGSCIVDQGNPPIYAPIITPPSGNKTINTVSLGSSNGLEDWNVIRLPDNSKPNIIVPPDGEAFIVPASKKRE